MWIFFSDLSLCLRVMSARRGRPSCLTSLFYSFFYLDFEFKFLYNKILGLGKDFFFFQYKNKVVVIR